MLNDKNVKFIRVRGRVVPIKADKYEGNSLRKDRGVDLRKKGSPGSIKERRKISQDVFKKHGKEPSAGKRVKRAVVGSAIMGGWGALMGSPFGKKGAIIGGAALGAFGALIGGSGGKEMSNRSYNKHFGKALAKAKKKGSSV